VSGRTTYVIRAITADRDVTAAGPGTLPGYDVAAIVAELDLLHPDDDRIPQETFWEVVEKHHRHDEGAGA